jgi:hypothetical protein
MHSPCSTHRCQRGDRSKRECHPRQHRQPVPQKGLFRAREYEWQYRQDARAEDRQRSAQKYQKDQGHIVCIAIFKY